MVRAVVFKLWHPAAETIPKAGDGSDDIATLDRACCSCGFTSYVSLLGLLMGCCLLSRAIPRIRSDMSDFVFNAAKGRVIEKCSDDPTRVGVLLLKASEPDGTMRLRQTITDLLTANTEANFTNYSRKTLTATITEDDSTNRVSVDIPDLSWSVAGGNTDNSLVKLVIYYDESGTDATRIPLTAHDFKITTNGTNLQAQVATAGFYRAQ